MAGMLPSLGLGQRVLVTGGTGFIGRHLVATLLSRGARVRVLARNPGTIPAEWAAVEIRRGELEDAASLTAACQGVDTVFHAAGYAHAWADDSAQAATRHWRVNAEGTRRSAQAAGAAGASCFVFLSSVKAMGEPGERCVDESWSLPPATPYGQAKRAAETWVLEAGQHYGMRVVNLRLALVYGPGGKGNLERMAAAIRRGWFPPLPEVGNRRSLVHAADVAQAALLAAEQPAADGRTYIVTDGQYYSSRELYDLIRRGLGKAPTRLAVPAAALRALARTGDLLNRLGHRRLGFDSEALDKLLGWACYRCDRIQQELGYRPRWTLAEALPALFSGTPGWP